MRLDDLADPFRVQQIGIALRRLLALHQVGVEADWHEPDAEGCELPVRIHVFRPVVLGDILRYEGLKDTLTFPYDEMGGIRRVDHVDAVDAAGIFLTDALEHALGAGPLDLHGNSRKLA